MILCWTAFILLLLIVILPANRIMEGPSCSEHSSLSDWETDDETDVVVQLTGVNRDDFNRTILTHPGKCTALGLESDEPHIQLGPDIFEGIYENASGTNMLFEVLENDDQPPEVKLMGTSFKVLDMKKLYIQKKSTEPLANVSAPTESSEEQAVEEHLGESMDMSGQPPHEPIEVPDNPSHILVDGSELPSYEAVGVPEQMPHEPVGTPEQMPHEPVDTPEQMPHEPVGTPEQMPHESVGASELMTHEPVGAHESLPHESITVEPTDAPESLLHQPTGTHRSMSSEQSHGTNISPIQRSDQLTLAQEESQQAITITLESGESKSTEPNTSSNPDVTQSASPMEGVERTDHHI